MADLSYFGATIQGPKLLTSLNETEPEQKQNWITICLLDHIKNLNSATPNYKRK